MIYFWFILGLAIGSFLNVCIYRLPRGESIVFPPSHCPNCGRPLAPLDLIPVVSFFFLRGRCRACGAKISLRYPLVEILTGAGFAALMPNVFHAIFFSILVVVFFIDLEYQVIPDSLNYLGLAVGLLYNFFQGWPVFLSALGGTLLGFALLSAISFFGQLYYKKEVMGAGDLYLAALLGAWLGWGGVLAAIFLAYLLAAAVLLVLLILRKVKAGQYVPFGPALCGGGLLALFFGRQLIGWYWASFWP